MDAIWLNAPDGQAPVLFVQGEPGIGKTPLVQECLARQAALGHRTVTASCDRLDRGAPLIPMQTLLTAQEAADRVPDQPGGARPAQTDVDDRPRRALSRLPVPTMTLAETAVITARCLKQQAPGRLNAEIHAKSGGNPLYLEDICHALADRPVPGAIGGLDAALPASLHAPIASRQERQERQEDADRRIVFAASSSPPLFTATT